MASDSKYTFQILLGNSFINKNYLSVLFVRLFVYQGSRVASLNMF